MTDAAGATIRALADPHRRALLDALRARDGRSVSELGEALPALGRHAVLKHLGVLEAAGLVTSEKVGRVRTVRLNPVPVVELARRWLDDYSATAGLALVQLRDHLAAENREEPAMSTTADTTRTVVAAIVVDAPPARVWRALTDPDETSRWFFGGRVESDWTVGAPLVYVDAATGERLISGTITALEPERLLAHTWRADWSPETAADPESAFEWLLEAEGPATRVTIRHSGIPVDTTTAEQVEGGNVRVLSALKTFVETGRTMSGMG